MVRNTKIVTCSASGTVTTWRRSGTQINETKTSLSSCSSVALISDSPLLRASDIDIGSLIVTAGSPSQLELHDETLNHIQTTDAISSSFHPFS